MSASASTKSADPAADRNIPLVGLAICLLLSCALLVIIVAVVQARNF
jgi:hypothetical protein